MTTERPEKLTVVYRMIDKEVGAFFPGVKDVNRGMILCYHRVGQHSEASLEYARKGRLATEEEYAALHKELRRINAPEYELVIGKRITRR